MVQLISIMQARIDLYKIIDNKIAKSLEEEEKGNSELSDIITSEAVELQRILDLLNGEEEIINTKIYEL